MEINEPAYIQTAFNIVSEIITLQIVSRESQDEEELKKIIAERNEYLKKHRITTTGERSMINGIPYENYKRMLNHQVNSEKKVSSEEYTNILHEVVRQLKIARF